MDYDRYFHGYMYSGGHKEKGNPGSSHYIIRHSVILLYDIWRQKAVDGYFIFTNTGNVLTDTQLLHEGKHRIWGWAGGFGHGNLYGAGNLYGSSDGRADYFGRLCGGFIGSAKSGGKEPNPFCALPFGGIGGGFHCTKRDIAK